MTNDNNKKEVDLRTPLEKGRLLLSITEFCQCVGISRVTYYAWKREGVIPAEGFETRLGAGVIRISVEAMIEWIARAAILSAKNCWPCRSK